MPPTMSASRSPRMVHVESGTDRSPAGRGDFAVLLLKRGPIINGTKHLVTAHRGVLGLPVGTRMAVRDVMARKYMGVRQGSITTY